MVSAGEAAAHIACERRTYKTRCRRCERLSVTSIKASLIAHHFGGVVSGSKTRLFPSLAATARASWPAKRNLSRSNGHADTKNWAAFDVKPKKNHEKFKKDKNPTAIGSRSFSSPPLSPPLLPPPLSRSPSRHPPPLSLLPRDAERLFSPGPPWFAAASAEFTPCDFLTSPPGGWLIREVREGSRVGSFCCSCCCQRRPSPLLRASPPPVAPVHLDWQLGAQPMGVSDEVRAHNVKHTGK